MAMAGEGNSEEPYTVQRYGNMIYTQVNVGSIILERVSEVENLPLLLIPNLTVRMRAG